MPTLPHSKMVDADWKYPAIMPRLMGELVVSEHPRHVMHWEEYGNADGEPIIFIHGGPGGGTMPAQARFFDPKRYRIILYDQRGCGQSRPHITEDLAGGLADNITAKLVDDIEALRRDRGITGKAHIFGGSWGSTLAMAYAQAYPQHVASLVLRGIFLCDKTDLSFFYQGNTAEPDNTDISGAYRAYTHEGEFTIPANLRDDNMAAAYAKAWADYVNVIPTAERRDMIGAYHARLNDARFTADERLQAALAWSVWEGVTSYLNQDVTDLGKFSDPTFAVAFATIENNYFYRSLRGEDAALTHLMSADGIKTLATLPLYIVQGAHDQVCVPASARKLKAALEAAGAKLEYVETVAGHSMTERTTNAVLVDFTDRLAKLAS